MREMLDLAFVRANLPLVEEKLRARGMDPAAVLGDFADADAKRRGAITEVESLKAQRNKLSEEIGKLKRSGADATAWPGRGRLAMVGRRRLNSQVGTTTTAMSGSHGTRATATTASACPRLTSASSEPVNARPTFAPKAGDSGGTYPRRSFR